MQKSLMSPDSTLTITTTDTLDTYDSDIQFNVNVNQKHETKIISPRNKGNCKVNNDIENSI